MTETDFKTRPWVDLNGWPYPLDALGPYFPKAQELLQVGPYNYDPAYWSTDHGRFLSFTENTLENRIWQLSPRTNFGTTHREKFRSSNDITVLLNATATDILTEASARVVEGIEVRSLHGKRVVIKAKHFVIACGGIDNPRLLLLARQHRPNGLGNDHDQVGRYFMQHPHVSAASVRFMQSKRWIKSYKDFKRGNLWLRGWIGLTDAAQEQHQALNCVAAVINRYISDSLTHSQAIGYVTLKRILLDLRRGRVPANFAAEVATMVRDTRGILVGFMRHVRDQNGGLYVMAEQAPNPDSCIRLSPDLDSMGLPKAEIDWRLLPIDKHTIRMLVQQAANEFRRLGIADVTPDEWLTTDDHTWPISLAGGQHHMGTTRMSSSPKEGVVDPDARVHGMDNLYIAGSSIFPTVGCANPTLTLLATSLKLANHLQARMAKSGETSAVA